MSLTRKAVEIIIRALAVMLIMSIWPLSASGEEPLKVHWNSGYWLNFTQEDGAGIYLELATEVFARSGAELVQVKEDFPFKRALANVRDGLADMSGGVVRDDANLEKYLLPNYPINRSRISVLFKREAIPWSGRHSMSGRSFVQIRGYKSSQFLLGVSIGNIFEAGDAEAAIGMVVVNRADGYIGNLTDINEGLETARSKFDMDMNDYQIEDVNEILLYPAFAKNDRGEIIAELWDQGMREMVSEGRAMEIYQKYGLGVECPDYSDLKIK